MEENWDCDGAKPYKRETFMKAVNFLARFLTAIIGITSKRVEFPDILPGADGEVEISWQNERICFLLSVPESDDRKAGVYGRNKKTRDEFLLNFYPNDEIDMGLIEWFKKTL
ncbi:MAG: hypothetical protein GF353_28735 [Candidatus Lokiarchaeota archaeon]|nr:hypothetical protein [Candidatus Lokiarchaeota archaeon]MBD3353989.1 hypothetical protein [Candidatus Lokiarchaeota archaeon]